MSGPITVIPPRQALVDERGNITRVWWLFLQEIFTRIGGANAMTNTELEALIFSLISDFQPTPAPMFVPDIIQPPEQQAFVPEIYQQAAAGGMPEMVFQC